MEIFEARVLGENLYLHQRFTQCSKWSTSPKKTFLMQHTAYKAYNQDVKTYTFDKLRVIEI
jgi:hypothetical protein